MIKESYYYNRMAFLVHVPVSLIALPAATKQPIWYDKTYYFNVRLKADIGPGHLNLPHDAGLMLCTCFFIYLKYPTDEWVDDFQADAKLQVALR